MNSLERTLITKSGYDHGWEVVVEEGADRVVLASALHRVRAEVTAGPGGHVRWRVALSSEPVRRELARKRGDAADGGEVLTADMERELGLLLHEAARLARALPDAPEARFARVVAAELAGTALGATEIERVVRQRVGQEIFRESLMDYWGGACAVTGITVPELLRASHAKAWAECASDAERLNVYNGFLLAAHLDALFDRHLMTFDAAGRAIFAPAVDSALRVQLGLAGEVKLRWLSAEHAPFLAWHRARFDGEAGRT